MSVCLSVYVGECVNVNVCHQSVCVCVYVMSGSWAVCVCKSDESVLSLASALACEG